MSAQLRMKNVFVGLGGLIGPDGILDSEGISYLAEEIAKLPNTRVSTWTWDKWENLDQALARTLPSDLNVVLGYSGAGSRATYLVARIDLLILLDPSPAWQMRTIEKNVKRAICFHNAAPALYIPFIGELGGGILRGVSGVPIETIDIAEEHLAVQEDESIRTRVLKEIEELG